MSLANKDRIFTNLYGFQSPGLAEAKKRGDWDKTKKLLEIGPDEIIERIKHEPAREELDKIVWERLEANPHLAEK